MGSNKFRLNKKMNKNLFSNQIEINDKMDISYTNESNLDKGKINLYESSNKKIGKELKKIFEGKYEKLMNKKGKIFNKNKSINTLGNNITNNSLIHLHYKLGNKFHKNINITDSSMLKKIKTGINLKKRMRTNSNSKNAKNSKFKPNNKNIMIECGYFSNNENYSKKYRTHISSLPNSSRKFNNKSNSIKNPKKIIIKPLENPLSFVNIELASKYPNIINAKLNKKINSKKLLDIN